MNKIKFSHINCYRLIKIGIFLFLISPLNSALAMFFQGPEYQWPLFYPAGGKAYTEFLPFLLQELKKILSDPSYVIPYD